MKDSRRTIPEDKSEEEVVVEIPTDAAIYCIVFATLAIAGLLTYCLSLSVWVFLCVAILVLFGSSIIISSIEANKLRKKIQALSPSGKNNVDPYEPTQRYSGKVLGFRSWKLGLDKQGEVILKPLTARGYEWEPAENLACCHREGHQAPASQWDPCDCGLYAFHDVNVSLNYSSTKRLQGVVLGSGNVQVHKEGWRSEKAEIVAFLRLDRESFLKRKRKKNPDLRLDKLLPKLSEKFNVPVFDTDAELLDYVKDLGIPVPAEAKPSFETKE